MTDVVEFQIGGELYALDIEIAREVVDMMPITPLPRSPPYIAGVINLRGEITSIVDLGTLLELGADSAAEGKKIIVLLCGEEEMPIGIIVDDVSRVISISPDEVASLGEGTQVKDGSYIRGIIRKASENDEEKKELVIWLDMQSALREQTTLVT
ncbi:MAG: chemotaxis protein CheW [Methanomicrobiales archaeon]